MKTVKLALFIATFLLMLYSATGCANTDFAVIGADNLIISKDGKSIFMNAELADATRKKYEFIKTDLQGKIKNRRSVMVRDAALSPSGEYILGVNMSADSGDSAPREALQIWRARSLGLKKTIARGAIIAGAVWFPKSDKVLYADKAGIYISDLKKRTVLANGSFVPLAVSADETRIAYISDKAALSDSNKIWQLDIFSGTKQEIVAASGLPDQAAFSDKKFYYVARLSSGWRLAAVDLISGRESELKTSKKGIAGLRFINEKDALMYSLAAGAVGPGGQGVGPQNVMAFDVRTGAEQLIAKKATLWDYNIDQDMLVWMMDDLTLRVKETP